MDCLPPLRQIAHICSDFPTKFGIPRQSGLVEGLTARIVFEPGFRDREAVRGLEGYSHIWLIWLFSQAVREDFSPTVRPPRLGGNIRMGVFATRSPYRPNPLGLSCVRLESVVQDQELGPVLTVSGADLMDGTPILDIKPYLPFTDSHPDAKEGFSSGTKAHRLTVLFPEELLASVPKELHSPLIQILEQDPRPSYQQDGQRVYGMEFAGMEVRFSVEGEILTVRQVFLTATGSTGRESSPGKAVR